MPAAASTGDVQLAPLSFAEVKYSMQIAVRSRKLRRGGRATHLWGPPGIGKSALMREIAKEERLNFIDLRMSLLNPVDLRGVPVAQERKTPLVRLPGEFVLDADGKNVKDDTGNFAVYKGGEPVLNAAGEPLYEITRMTEWWHPSFLPTKPGYLIHLDELNAAPNAVQASAYSLVLDGHVGEYNLPDDCYIVASGNRETDRAIVNPMSSALANRFTHLELMPSLRDWKLWALRIGVDFRIASFLTFKPELLFQFDPAKHKKAFCTPRSWETVSDWLSLTNGDVNAALSLINGSVGSGAGTQFSAFCDVMSEMPNPEAVILDGLMSIPMPKRADVSYAFAGALASVVRRQTAREKIISAFANYCKYAVQRMDRSPEIAACGICDIFVMPFFRAQGAMLAYDNDDYLAFEKKYGALVRSEQYLSPTDKVLTDAEEDEDAVV